MDPKALLKNPGTTPYARLKYLRSLPEEKLQEFFSGLFRHATEGREHQDWSALDAYLEEWERLADTHLQEDDGWVHYDSGPFVPLARPLAECRVCLVTTGGVYVEGQEPFDVRGDWSYRLIPRDTPRERLRIAHDKYDTAGALEDINCVFPYELMAELEAARRIREFAEIAYGFMGYIPEPQALIEETAPQAARHAREAGVEAAVIGTT